MFWENRWNRPSPSKATLSAKNVTIQFRYGALQGFDEMKLSFAKHLDFQNQNI